MVLDMDILDYDSHRKLAEQVFLEYGKVIIDFAYRDNNNYL